METIPVIGNQKLHTETGGTESKAGPASPLMRLLDQCAVVAEGLLRGVQSQGGCLCRAVSASLTLGRSGNQFAPGDKLGNQCIKQQ